MQNRTPFLSDLCYYYQKSLEYTLLYILKVLFPHENESANGAAACTDFRYFMGKTGFSAHLYGCPGNMQLRIAQIIPKEYLHYEPSIPYAPYIRYPAYICPELSALRIRENEDLRKHR